MNTKQLSVRPKKAPATTWAAHVHPEPASRSADKKVLTKAATAKQVATKHRARAAKTPSFGNLPLMMLSLSLEPFVSILSRHVKITEKARQAIEHDLAEAFEHASLQLLTSTNAPKGKKTQLAQDSDPILTTETAARLVGVSRPFMVKLIDSGAVQLHQMVGNQRRVLRSAVLGWRAKERSRQVKAMKRLSEDLDEEIFAS